jgi:aspartate/methionine/tyrosine aminotransferase
MEMSERVIAERMNGLAGESAFQVLAAANTLEAKGKTVIHFEIGEPDFPTAPHVVDAAKEALDAGYTTYCNAQGLVPLREAIVAYTRAYKGIAVRAEQVVVAPGGKPIIFATISVLVDPGDEVVYPDPGFPTYGSVIRYAGGIPVPIPLTEENDFRLSVEALRSRITAKTKLIILNSPSNPTGGILTDSDLQEIAAVIAGRNIFVLSDEIYSRIVYDGGRAGSIASLPGMQEKTIILDGFSKTYCMTGWRLGYGIMQEGIAEKMTRLLINSNSCTTHFVQRAGIAALEGPQSSVDAMVREFARRRDFIVERLNRIEGVTCRKPAGAFYAFPNVSGTGFSSREVADFLLQEAGVAALDGSGFGAAGAGYLRLSFATSFERIHAGLDRIEDALKKLARTRHG